MRHMRKVDRGMHGVVQNDTSVVDPKHEFNVPMGVIQTVRLLSMMADGLRRSCISLECFWMRGAAPCWRDPAPPACRSGSTIDLGGNPGQGVREGVQMESSQI